MFRLHEKRVLDLRRDLLAWFARVSRPLPWRRERTVYGTWVAEIMLQQTTVAVVEPFWLRFMERFPTVQDLAAAPEQEVLGLWSGLGYYSRARNLLRAARLVADAGQWPVDRAGWRQLPGVGAYTSAAVVSQALGLAEPAVDANARRVLTRWLVDEPDQLPLLKPALLEEAAGRLVPDVDPGTWNEAVMELGALVCRARNPRCQDCPVLDHCSAGLAGRSDEIPAPAGKTRAQPVSLDLLAVHCQGHIMLTRASGPPLLKKRGSPTVVRSDFRYLHQGLWSLPTTPWYHPPCGPGWPDSKNPGPGKSALAWVPEMGDLPAEARLVGQFSHAITRYSLRVDVHLLDLNERLQSISGQELRMGIKGEFEKGDKEIIIQWVPFRLNRVQPQQKSPFPLSALADKAFKVIGDNFS